MYANTINYDTNVWSAVVDEFVNMVSEKRYAIYVHPQPFVIIANPSPSFNHDGPPTAFAATVFSIPMQRSRESSNSKNTMSATN